MTTSNDPEPYRPALVTLSEDVRERVDELRTGLVDEDRVLEWFQEITIRTLGRIDERVYWDLARQFRGEQGVLLAALLRPGKRRGDMAALEEPVAIRVREHLVAHYVVPAHRDAFRELRTDATEYGDGAGDGDAHNPKRQRFIAMRPALSELETWQEHAIEALLDGFDARGDLLDWGHDLMLATHGELDREWLTRVYDEEPTVGMLLGETPADARARRLFAAHHVLPRYRAGVRVLAGRAGEVPDEGKEQTEASYA
jgi:hypothetical protein